MPALGFFGWIIIGGLAGWISSKIMGTDEQMGALKNILVGIIGGFIGGFVLTQFGFNVAGGGLIFSFFTCLLGAVIFLAILGFITKKK